MRTLKDDYRESERRCVELEQENERLRAGLEKVRKVEEKLRLIARRYKGSWANLPDMLRELALDLAGVDHG